MEFLIAFLEGIITFISPCLLPMLPVYVVYFSGGASANSLKKTMANALGFVLGFTILFVALGAFAGVVGSFIKEYQTPVNIVMGLVMVVFGLHYMGVFKIGFLNRTYRVDQKIDSFHFVSSMLFGMIFAVGWTPCVGVFLGSALMLAAAQGSFGEGVLMLLCYSLGLGVPFIISAALIDKLKGVFGFIKRNYRIVNIVCGALLIAVGLFMMTGMLGRLLSLFS